METNGVLLHKRIRSVDIAKGIGIICIILGHLNNSSINRVVFTFHVPLFYLITGYFINEKGTVAEFIKKKRKTLLIPYCITCCLIILFGTLKGCIMGKPFEEFKEWVIASIYGAGGTLSRPFHIRGIGAIWFLLASFWGSVCLRFSLKFHLWKRIVFIVALFLFGVVTKKWIWLPFSLQEGACAAFFLYLGFLYHKGEKKLNELPSEIKCFNLLWACITWVFFIKDFQSFWLVQCDFGRGAVDIFGSICACSVILLLSRIIDRKTALTASFLSYCGKYSLLVLSVHILELNLFPWHAILEKLISMGLPASFELVCIIAGKLTLDLFGAWLLSKLRFARKVFGYSE